MRPAVGRDFRARRCRDGTPCRLRRSRGDTPYLAFPSCGVWIPAMQRMPFRHAAFCFRHAALAFSSLRHPVLVREIIHAHHEIVNLVFHQFRHAAAVQVSLHATSTRMHGRRKPQTQAAAPKFHASHPECRRLTCFAADIFIERGRISPK